MTEVVKRHVSLSLIRKRSEHNECLVSTLEEIALHQEELEEIGNVLGRTCGKTLRILLLQSNVISRMHPSHLRYFRSIDYLNLALNNIRVIEGIEHFEFLNKLDLTLNFIDVDALEDSIECLRHLRSLKELYLVGNPCMYNDVLDEKNKKSDDVQPDFNRKSKNVGWKGCRMYIIAKLPHLHLLDGNEILRSERICALQCLPQLETELHLLENARSKNYSNISKDNKGYQQRTESPQHTEKKEILKEEVTHHCPDNRTQVSHEMAQQKAEKEKNERSNQPKLKVEKDFEDDQERAIERCRQREEKGIIRQCNEGKLTYKFDEAKKAGHLLLDVSVQKHLSSSLINVEIHPTYVSIVIKSKVLRLKLPTEIRAEESTAQRSTTTGHLLLVMPRCDETSILLKSKTSKQEENKNHGSRVKINKKSEESGKRLGSIMLQDAMILKGAVQIRGLVPTTKGGVDYEQNETCNISMKEISSRIKNTNDITASHRFSSNDGIEDEPPPLF